jgi:hypothetical protein
MHLTCDEANVHLLAYKEDPNPGTSSRRTGCFAAGGIEVPPNMLKHLDRALDELAPDDERAQRRPNGKPKTRTVRDLYIRRTLLIGRKQLPIKVDGETVASLAREWKTTRAAIKQAITRLRQQEKDPVYNVARAFRHRRPT